MPIKNYKRDEGPANSGNPARSDGLRAALADVQVTRNSKLARIFADPAQVTKTAEGIVIGPRGEDVLEKAEREAREARRAADKEKAAL